MGHGRNGAGETATVQTLPPRARFVLRLDPSLLPRASAVGGFPLDVPINRCTVAAGKRTMRLGPDEWLLWAQDREGEQIGREVSASLFQLHHSLVDISHARVTLSVSGTRAALTINSGCALDLSAAAFPAGTATRTLLGKAEIVLARWDAMPSFEIECARSFAGYVQDFLHEAQRQIVASADGVALD
jgi:sarcosine oxidase, subunit gamma